MSKASAIIRLPAGRRTKWAVLVFWLIIVAVTGPLAGKLAMPRCRCGCPPAPRPPKSLPAPGTACVSCSPSTPTAFPAATRSPASRLSKPSAPAHGPPLAHKNRRSRRESCPSCVRATAGLNGTQLDLIPPPRSGYTPVNCGNTGRGGRFHGSLPRTEGPGHPFSMCRWPGQIWPTTGPQPPGTVCRTAPGHASDPASGNTGTGPDLGF